MTPEQELEVLQRFIDRIPETVAALREAVECHRLVGAWVIEPAAVSLERARWLLASPVPEPDHSMCARLEPAEPMNGHEQWALVVPAGDAIHMWRRHDVERMGFAIPDPEPTVVERAIEVASSIPIKWENDTPVERLLDADTAAVVVAAIADAGLLREDGA